MTIILRASALALALTLCSCSSGGGAPALPGPSANVNGEWFGSWSEQVMTTPASGTVAFDLVQAADGSVTGVVALTGATCTTGGNFVGSVHGDLLTGSVTDGGVTVEFTVGAEDWDDPGSEDIAGIFTFSGGAGCPSVQSGFLAQFVRPLVVDESTPERVGITVFIDDQETRVHPVWMLRGDGGE